MVEPHGESNTDPHDVDVDALPPSHEGVAPGHGIEPRNIAFKARLLTFRFPGLEPAARIELAKCSG